ncbi:MAG: hypothetical protein FWD61_19510 [Phycisphaerales bacterium]|nr:hypothetical protein [Phycisphaerales bacterium]
MVILADMLELGPQSEAFHREVGKQVAACRFDLMIAIGKQMSFAADAAEVGGGGVRVVRFTDTVQAKATAKQLLEDGDQILLKGSHGMALETLLETFK